METFTRTSSGVIGAGVAASRQNPMSPDPPTCVLGPSVANPPVGTHEEGGAKVPSDSSGIVQPEGTPAPVKSGDGAMNSTNLISPVEDGASSLHSSTGGAHPKAGRPKRLDPAQLPD
jgi:hypothetical protein